MSPTTSPLSDHAPAPQNSPFKKQQSKTKTEHPSAKPKCQPEDYSGLPPLFSMPADGTDSSWITPVVAASTADPKHFLGVHENLLRNPNIISSHLFRAEILYDSDKDASADLSPLGYCGHKSGDIGSCGGTDEEKVGSRSFSKFTDCMKEEMRPLRLSGPVDSYAWTRTVVRRLVPRNPVVDQPLIQTCHFFFRKLADGSESHLILQLPHVTRQEDVPFYHPAVSAVAFMYEFAPHNSTGRLSVTFRLFPQGDDKESALLTSVPLPSRLQRTALNLVQLVHKHMLGREGGYQKRVHHDQVVPQPRLQDTYTRLKMTYAKAVISTWKEDTDPTKHVFEDLGIAAFLIELWKDMYGPIENFPGFVDIGCGNGLLVDILNREGYPGWGFDVRERKSWENVSPKHSHNLQEMVLIPPVFGSAPGGEPYRPRNTDVKQSERLRHHNGLFPQNTFIVSNHADQLTVWTPLLAYLSSSPFIAIPCCSHDFGGSKFRARENLRRAGSLNSNSSSNANVNGTEHNVPDANPLKHAAESGCLQKKKPGQNSAYSTLCTYIARLAEEVGYEAEQEILRIPSTRNTAIIGRKMRTDDNMALEDKLKLLKELVQGEMETTIEEIEAKWMAEVEKLAKLKSNRIGHS